MSLIRNSLLFLALNLFAGQHPLTPPKYIDRKWEEKHLGIKGDITTVDIAIHEFVDGVNDQCFDKEFFSKLQDEIKSNPKGNGEFKTYWPNGQLKARVPYKNGKAHGHVHGWFENGKDAFKGYFDEGIKQGIHITFYPSTHKQSDIDARILQYNLKGLLNQEQTTSHKNGDLELIMVYKNGKPYGKYAVWGNGEKPIFSTVYDKGRRIRQKTLGMILFGNGDDKIWAKYSQKLLNQFERIAKDEFGLTATGSGVSIPFDVEYLNLKFSIPHKTSLEGARSLIVKLTERFKTLINSDEKIRPYLREYPFPSCRAEIDLDFYELSRNASLEGSVRMVFPNRKNELVFYLYDQNNPNKKFVEAYNQSMKIVDEQVQQAILNQTQDNKQSIDSLNSHEGASNYHGVTEYNNSLKQDREGYGGFYVNISK